MIIAWDKYCHNIKFYANTQSWRFDTDKKRTVNRASANKIENYK